MVGPDRFQALDRQLGVAQGCIQTPDSEQALGRLRAQRSLDVRRLRVALGERLEAALQLRERLLASSAIELRAHEVQVLEAQALLQVRDETALQDLGLGEDGSGVACGLALGETPQAEGERSGADAGEGERSAPASCRLARPGTRTSRGARGPAVLRGGGGCPSPSAAADGYRRAGSDASARSTDDVQVAAQTRIVRRLAGAPRLPVEQHRARGERAGEGLLVGMAPGQELVEQHAQRIHVPGRRGRLTGELLGRGVARRERSLSGARDVLSEDVGVVEQLGDAEVEQHRAAVGRGRARSRA